MNAPPSAIRGSKRLCSLLILAACVFGASVALAESEAITAHYGVPRECPGHHAWGRAVRARLPPLLKTHPSIETLSVRVERLASEGDNYVGTLSTTWAEPPRTVRGATCAAVIEALSFIGALGLERAASRATAPDENQRASSTPPELGTPERAVEADGGAKGVEQSAARQRVRLGAVGYALMQRGLALPVGFGAGVRIAWAAASLQPLFLLGVYSSGSIQSSLAGGHVRVAHWSTHVVGCPWRFPSQGSLAIRGCGELDVGRTRGEGFGLELARTDSAPWISAGAQLRGELVLGDRLELAATVAGVLPLWHSRFYLLPNVDVYTTPTFGPRADVAASVLF